MSITTSWKSELSFAERMQNTLSIAKAWQTKHICDFSTARSKAQDNETGAFENSISREAYEKECQEITLSLECSADEPHDLNSPEESGRSTPGILPNVSGKPTYKLGPYEACTHLYSGLFSTIYLTQSPTPPPKHLAIKCTSPAREQPPHNSRREARILSSLSHPHIIPLLATNTTTSLSCPYLLTFPYKPLTLADLLLPSSPSSPIPRSILHNLFSALTYLHDFQNAIIHRDVKPTNILLSSPTGPASLADFGIAWSPSDRDSEPPGQKITDIGTTCYRAPELLFGDRAYGVGVDLWAAGCVAAEVFVHDAGGKGGGRDRRKEGEGEGKGEWTLFDAGELGSELALVKSIFETLGTPDEEVWPECSRFPDWGKMTFKQFAAKGWEKILPGVGEEERDLVGRLVRYESGERMGAGEVSGF